MAQPEENDIDPVAGQTDHSRRRTSPLPLSIGELPLFPLDLVLFPDMPLPLHIFEDRYREMVNLCVRESRPFGIVLVTGTDPSTGRARTSDIGCVARIARVERLPDGHMNIEVIGEGRFRILDTHEQQSYRVGLTEPYEDQPGDSGAIGPMAVDVERLLRDFLARSFAAAGHRLPDFDLPDDPQLLSFTVAHALPVDVAEKQTLLSQDDTLTRLSTERDILLREVTRLRRAEESREVVWSPVETDAFRDYICAN